MKAIETTYKGYRFRSRLEARWAVFFDTLGIDYQYEVQGFENAEGDRYLPDFYLPKTQTWVEVKGDPQALHRDWERMARLLDFGGVLPHFGDSFGSTRGLLLLGDVPQPMNGTYFHPIVQHHKGLCRSWVTFAKGYSSSLWVVDDGVLSSLVGLDRQFGLDAGPDGWADIAAKYLATRRFYTCAKAAYSAARGARFEHGESGAWIR